MNKCELCEKSYDKSSSLAKHIKNKHGIEIKDYYDSYLKKDGDGICKLCNKQTTFHKLESGYRDYCSPKCGSLHGQMKSGKTQNSKTQVIKNKTNTSIIPIFEFNKIGVDKLNPTSVIEDVIKFLKSCGINDIIRNDKSILGSEDDKLDIVIPSKNIAISYNGLYLNSEYHGGKNRKYNLLKTNACEKAGFQLIQIYEDEWIHKNEIVKSRLTQLLGVSHATRIHARKCNIELIQYATRNSFLDSYHIQGKDNAKIRLGAFFFNELVAVMTFSRGSIAKGSKAVEGTWELNRFCSNPKFHSAGIAGKLLTHFKRNYEWSTIFSYADRRWSVGQLYYKLGFELSHYTQPNYFYIVNGKREHRYKYRKRPSEPKHISEWELRKQEGLDRVWDSGNIKFILTKGT